LEHACRDHARWAQHHPTLALSVNLSARQLATAGLSKAIRTLLTTTSMDPTKLVLEITETMLVDDSNASTSTLTDLDALGIRLALDDFGAGYSSLSYLDRLPIRIIKIDQQFVSRLGRSDDSTIVVRGIVAIAHQLDLVVVAEGVETRVQHDHVAAIGCDNAQGVYYSGPLNGDQLDAYLIGTGPIARPIHPGGAPGRVFEDA
jgi:EAL domain-containing protein (putative c-di-GMP-specific phosphodiesterase class I)